MYEQADSVQRVVVIMNIKGTYENVLQTSYI